MKPLNSSMAARRLLFCVLVMNSAVFAATTPERSAIDEQFKWDLTKMYASPEDWEAHAKKVESMVHDFGSRKGTIGQSAKALEEALKLHDDVNVQSEKLSAYAAMKRDED